MFAKNASRGDSASRLRGALTCILAAVLSLAPVLPALADQPPGLPSGFWGTATFQHANVADGTVVAAWINGVNCGETLTFTTGDQSVYSIDVSADNPDTPGVIEGGTEGDTITFKIGAYAAGQTSAWYSGTNLEANINAFNRVPLASDVVPSEGSSVAGEKISFTSTHPDADGWQDVKLACFGIGQHSSGADGFRAYYSRTTNQVFLCNDDSTRWLGRLQLGSDNTIENSRVILHLADMTAWGEGTDFNITWSMTFKSLTSGPKSIYLNTWDQLNLRRKWRIRGTWTVNGTNQSPVFNSIVPESGSSDPDNFVSFTTSCSDPNGWPQLLYVSFAIGQDYTGMDGFRAYYNQNTNGFYLANDDNSAWLGKATPGAAEFLENSRVKLDIANMSVIGLGTTLTVTWSVAFKSTVDGTKKILANIRDDQAAVTSWQQVGTWTINGDPGSVGAVPMQFSGVPLEPMEEEFSDDELELPALEPEV